MSTSFQTSVTDLAGMTTASNNMSEWDFQGITISKEQYFGDIDADLAANSAEDCFPNDSATVKGDLYNRTENVPAWPSSYGHRLSGSTCVSTSYADTEASMRPNYAALSYDSTTQYSNCIPTPTISIGQDENDYTSLSQNGSASMQQISAYAQFPTHSSGPTPLDSWYYKNERHEQIAFNLSIHAADSMTQKTIKKSTDKKVQKRK